MAYLGTANKMVKVHYGDETILCSVIESPTLSKRIRIHVHANGSVELKVPNGLSKSDIQSAAQKRAKWISSNVKQVSSQRVHFSERKFVNGESHFYLGRRHKLFIVAENNSPFEVKIANGKICLKVPSSDSASIKRLLNDWYSERAAKYFNARFKEVSRNMAWVNNSPKFRLIRMKRQWGNCSPKGSITLNPALVRAPRHCIDYVLIHELCHLVEHNHSKKFYSLLDKYCPNWKETKRQLDGMSELILSDFY